MSGRPLPQGRVQITVQVGHVVVMIFLILIQDHVKVAGIDAGLFDTADLDTIPLQGKGVESFKKALLVRTQIQQGSDSHVSADAAGAVEIEGFGDVSVI